MLEASVVGYPRFSLEDLKRPRISNSLVGWGLKNQKYALLTAIASLGSKVGYESLLSVVRVFIPSKILPQVEKSLQHSSSSRSCIC